MKGDFWLEGGGEREGERVGPTSHNCSTLKGPVEIGKGGGGLVI